MLVNSIEPLRPDVRLRENNNESMIQVPLERNPDRIVRAVLVSIRSLSDLYDIVMRAETFECCSVEFFLMVRMRNADKKLRPFLH